MDLQERMEQMRRDMEQRMAQMREKLEQRDILQPRPSTPVSNTSIPSEESHLLTSLIHHKGLEDETETKIGMFEQLYHSTYAQLTFGYGDPDFAPLINLLGSICEIELYESLRWVAETTGIAFPARSRTTFSHFIDLLSHPQAKAYLHASITDDEIATALHHLNKIRLLRNNANHKGVVERHRFVRFFEEHYAPFFNQCIPSFIQLKHHTVSKNHKFQSSTDGKADNFCILWTNTERLALKYCQNINTSSGASVPLAIIEQLITPFINEARNAGIYYILLDASEYDPISPTSAPANWQTHLQKLDEYCAKQFDCPSTVHGLFIIGGEDVIPMPTLRNPLNDDCSNSDKTDILEATIESDWIYSFHSGQISLTAEGHLDISRLGSATTCRHVGRLPIEDGLMESDITTDIGGYFSKMLKSLNEGIKVDNIGTVACQSCCMIANKMVNGFPNIDLHQLAQSYHHEDVFISPNLDLAISENNPEAEAMSRYISLMRECDMLMFTLHGGPQPNSPHYFGEAHIPARTGMIPVFTPSMLHGSKAKIVVPICCWGARFIGYRRNTSALLTAMYDSDTLLFMGSCRSALGEFDTSFMDENGQLRADPQPRYAEILIRLFMQLLLKGMRAGEALSLAKINYLKYYAEGNMADILTVQQFNLFGDPMLRVIPVGSTDNMIQDFPSGIATAIPPIEIEHMYYDKQDAFRDDWGGNIGLLQRVRGFVDSNLAYIRDTINKQLYQQYNIAPSTLRRITGYRDSHGTRGFRFIYTNDGDIPATVTAFADSKGRLLRVLHSF